MWHRQMISILWTELCAIVQRIRLEANDLLCQSSDLRVFSPSCPAERSGSVMAETPPHWRAWRPFQLREICVARCTFPAELSEACAPGRSSSRMSEPDRVCCAIGSLQEAEEENSRHGSPCWVRLQVHCMPKQVVLWPSSWWHHNEDSAPLLNGLMEVWSPCMQVGKKQMIWAPDIKSTQKTKLGILRACVIGALCVLVWVCLFSCSVRVMFLSACVCERECVRECVCVRERECVCERGRESACVCVWNRESVCDRGIERER